MVMLELKKISLFSLILLTWSSISLAQIPGFTSPPESKTIENEAGQSEVIEAESGEKYISFNFKDTDIDVVLKFFADIAKLTIIKDEGVRGKVTVISAQKIPLEDALEALESILEVKGYTMVRSGKIVKVVSQKKALTKKVETMVGKISPQISPADQIITQVIPLEYISAPELKKDLDPLALPGGHLIANTRSNTLIITDVASNLQRLAEIIKELDVEVYAEKIQIEIIPLTYADETELANILNQTLNLPEAELLRPRIQKKEGQIGEKVLKVRGEIIPGIIGKVKIIPDNRLHSLIVITAETNIPIIKELISALDKASPATADNIRVFALQNGQAENIAKVLNELFANLETGETKAKKTKKESEKVESEDILSKEIIGGIIGKVGIVADKRTNALIITTFPQNFPAIARLVEKLDVRSSQALIEVLIAEVTLTDELKYGLEWTYNKEYERRGGVAKTYETYWDLDSFIGEGFKYTIVRGEVLEQILQALAKDTELKILSSPRILASDNQEAKIKIGEEVPVLKDVIIDEDGDTIKSYEYKDVMIELTVTPTINANRDVSLKVTQVIKKISSYDTELNAPIIATREANTFVVIKDGQTVVIGGLIKDDETKSLSKIPLLGDIPLLGMLFRKERTVNEKTELLVFLTPHVITTSEEANQVSVDQKEETKIIAPMLEKEKK